MPSQTRQIDGIESLPENAKFVGNGKSVNDWTKAMVWSPSDIAVSEGVAIVDTHTADGTAPAMTSGGLEDKNGEVEGWTKYELER